MKTVVFYDHHPEKTMDDIMKFFPQHQQNEDHFVQAGKVLGIGAFSIPGEGAMAIFTDRESAEAFVENDPFVQEGLVSVTIKDWQDELAE